MKSVVLALSGKSVERYSRPSRLKMTANKRVAPRTSSVDKLEDVTEISAHGIRVAVLHACMLVAFCCAIGLRFFPFCFSSFPTFLLCGVSRSGPFRVSPSVCFVHHAADLSEVIGRFQWYVKKKKKKKNTAKFHGITDHEERNQAPQGPTVHHGRMQRDRANVHLCARRQRDEGNRTRTETAL